MIDIDFRIETDSRISFSRDSTARGFDTNGNLDSFGRDVMVRPAFDADGNTPLGLSIWGRATNSFAGSDAPATQTVALAAGVYTLSVYGAGSVSLSGGASGVAREDGPLLYTVTKDGNVRFTVSGAVEVVQNENTAFVSTPIRTGGGPAERAKDFAGVDLDRHPDFIDLSGFTIVMEFMPKTMNESGTMFQLDDGTLDNRITCNYHYTDNHAGLTVIDDGAIVAVADPQPPYLVRVNEINRVALSWDPASDTIAISLNGSPVAAKALSALPSGLSTFRIGQSLDGTILDGYVARLRILDDGSTPAQLRALSGVDEPTRGAFIQGSAGDDVIDATRSVAGQPLADGNDLIAGGDGEDTIRGGGGNDVIEGGRDNQNPAIFVPTGRDVLSGGRGDDFLYADTPDDVIIERAGEGFDTVFSNVDYTLAAGSEIEVLRANRPFGLTLTGNGFDNSSTAVSAAISWTAKAVPTRSWVAAATIPIWSTAPASG